jgi:hypothetical protein
LGNRKTSGTVNEENRGAGGAETTNSDEYEQQIKVCYQNNKGQKISNLRGSKESLLKKKNTIDIRRNELSNSPKKLS